MNHQISPDVIAAWDRGDKVEAIRALRAATGLELREAMQALESGSYTVPLPRTPTPGQPLPPEALAAAARGDKIEAIKLARKTLGLDLREAKAAVEAMNGTAEPHRNQRLAPGEVPRSRVSWAGVVTLLGAALVIGWFALSLLRP